jgi:5-deoxy-glucuronate isomerase
MPRTVRLRSRQFGAGESGTLVSITPRQAGWKYVRFVVRQLAAGLTLQGRTEKEEYCFVLLEGRCRIDAGGGINAMLGPRANVFSSYPHAVYLPPRTAFSIAAAERSVIAECRAPATGRHAARVIRPEDCGYEIRGGGNATRQIIDILPPAFPAERLMICEVLTPSGNWSSYPPHKHDTDNPPVEVDLEETYYYRFGAPEAYGLQRLYGPGDRGDQALTVRHGDLVLVRSGYHPFVSAYGYDAYYLNVLAGTRRSMAASDDPRYAAFRREWPEPGSRMPLVRPPRA